MKNFYPVYTTIEKEPNTICKNLEEAVFDYPFFNEGVAAKKSKSTEKYNLKFGEVEKENSDDEILELKGLIFNVSHCGSTLLCSMLNQIKNVRIVSESEAINGLLLSKKLHSICDDEIKKQLKAIIRLYQQKTDEKSSLVIKLTSWNIYFIELFLEIFPEIKWIYLDRDTEPLITSLMKKDGGFIDWWNHPVDYLRKHFIEPEKEIKNKEEYLRELVRGHRKHATDNKEKENLFLEYPEFIESYEEVISYFRLKPTNEELKAIKEIIKYDAKSMVNKLWK